MFLDFQLPLWPDSASTNATQIDAIYIFLTVVSVIMTRHTAWSEERQSIWSRLPWATPPWPPQSLLARASRPIAPSSSWRDQRGLGENRLFWLENQS
jgi:hypothetical protein